MQRKVHSVATCLEHLEPMFLVIMYFFFSSPHPPIPPFLVHYPSSAPLFTFQEPWCTEPCIQKLKRIGYISSFIWKSAALWLHRFSLQYLADHCAIADHICTSLLSLSIVKLRGKYLQIDHIFSHMSECISVSAREILPRWRRLVPAFSLFVLIPPRYWRCTAAWATVWLLFFIMGFIIIKSSVFCEGADGWKTGLQLLYQQ